MTRLLACLFLLIFLIPEDAFAQRRKRGRRRQLNAVGDTTTTKTRKLRETPKEKKERLKRALKEAERRGTAPDVETLEKRRQRQESQIRKRTKPGKKGDDDLSVVGRDIKDFGESVAYGIDKLIKKKHFDLMGDPWTIQGIPLIFNAPVTGFHLGVHFLINNIRREDPHKVSLVGQVLATHGGKMRHFLKLDLPYAFNNRYRITSELRYTQDVTNRFFGIGNNTQVENRLVDNNSILFQNDRTQPSFQFRILRRFGKYFRAGPVFGLKWTEVRAPTGSLVASNQPVGAAGGRTHYMGVAGIYDTLDFEPYPREGAWHELYFQAYPMFLGSNYEFYRTTYTWREYWPLHRTLTLAKRSLVEFIIGDAPYYELASVGGSDATLGFGADRFLRGYYSNQFIDRIKLVVGLELRWDPIQFDFAGQKLHLGFVPFIDVGRVWDKVFPVRIKTLHASTGWGFRLVWNERLILRGDFAVNSQRAKIFFELGHSF